MNTIEEKIMYIESIREDLSNAIESTGANINDSTEFRLYANLIRSQFEVVSQITTFLDMILHGSTEE